MNLVFVLISCFLIINVEASNHPLTELDKMFCMFQYRAEIKQLRRLPGKQDVRAEAYDAGPDASLCHTYCQMWNGVNWVEKRDFPSPEFTPCGLERVCSSDSRCVSVLMYERTSGSTTAKPGSTASGSSTSSKPSSSTNKTLEFEFEYV